MRPSRFVWRAAGFLVLGLSLPIMAAVLPEDRAELMYHAYSGGGLDVNGPAFSLRKSIGKSFSVAGYHYIDSLSSATIDVMTTASPYREHREENGVSVDYLRGKSSISAGWSQSTENDYDAKTAFVGISDSFFGDLTTLSLGYSRGDDVVGKNYDASWVGQDVRRHKYTLGLSQILTKNLVVAFDFDATTDEGAVLNNPYRQYGRFTRDGGGNITGYQFLGGERYPDTHTSNAAALRLIYYLPNRAALMGEYRYFTDTWGIRSSNYDIKYTHPIGSRWIVDTHYRFYTQNKATFYDFDLQFDDGILPVARDKELSTYDTTTLGFGVSYVFAPTGWRWIDKGSMSFRYDRLSFNYKDFYDVQAQYSPNYPLYSFDADVMTFYMTLLY